MKKKITSLISCAMLLALCLPAEAQEPKKVPRIGWVSGSGDPNTPFGSQVEAFRQGLRDLGYIEGKNMVVEYRSAEGEVDREVAQPLPECLDRKSTRLNSSH